MSRVVGVLRHPRTTMTDAVRQPSFLGVWVVTLFVVAACGGVTLSTLVGQQALVDERVRVIETLGGQVNDARYAELLAHPPLVSYVTSGGRVLLMPPITLLVAAGLVALSAIGGVRIRFVIAMSIVVHASVVLALQQVVAVPAQLVRESLGSPTTFAGLLPMIEEGTLAARVLGAIDVFGVWWIWLLALGLAAATGRSATQWLWRLATAYLGVAIVIAAVTAVLARGGV